MSRSSHSVVGLDVGYGHVKAVWSAGHSEPSTLSFPAIAPVAGVNHSALALQDDGCIEVAVGTGTYLVGPDAATGLIAGSTGRSQTEHYSGSPEYLALTKGALYFTGLTQIETLCLGLPVHLFAQRKGDVERNARGSHIVKGRTIQVERVIVVPQPMGALIHLGKLDKLRADTVLIIDVGFGTVDWLLVETQNGKRKMVPARSGGQPIGVRELIDSMLASISKNAGMQYTRVDKIESALAGSGQIVVAGTPVKLLDHLEAARPKMNQAFAAITKSVGNGSDLDHIILSGGGALLYQDYVKAQFGGVPITVMHEPAFANARGFHATALSVAGSGVNGK